MAKVATALRCRRFKQAVDVFEEAELGFLHLEEVIDVPPEDTLLAFDAVCLIEWTRDRVVLAGKTTDDHVDTGNFNLAGFGLLQDLIDVFVDNGIIAEAIHVATGRELTRLGSGRFPLICPNGAEGAGGFHIKIGITRVGIAFEAQTKSADASKKLGNFDL